MPAWSPYLQKVCTFILPCQYLLHSHVVSRECVPCPQSVFTIFTPLFVFLSLACVYIYIPSFVFTAFTHLFASSLLGGVCLCLLSSVFTTLRVLFASISIEGVCFHPPSSMFPIVTPPFIFLSLVGVCFYLPSSIFATLTSNLQLVCAFVLPHLWLLHSHQYQPPSGQAVGALVFAHLCLPCSQPCLSHP